MRSAAPGPPSPPRAGGVEVALLDREGVIVAIDDGWRAFCEQNGGDLGRCGVGTSYLGVCDAAADDPATAATAAAIRAALAGQGSTMSRLRLPCEGPAGMQWFDLVVTSRYDRAGTCIGAAVLLLPLPAAARGPGDPPPPDVDPPAFLPLDLPEVLDAVNDGIVVAEAATLRRVYVNAAVLGITGHTVDELARVPLGAPATPADGARLQAAVRRAVETGESVSVDITARDRGGRTIPVESRVTHRPPAVPGAPGYVVLVIRDLRERLAAQERLRLSEASFRAAFEQAPIGMMVVGLEGSGRRVVARANSAAEAFLGVPTGQLAGRDLADFAEPDDEEQARRAAREFVSGGRSMLTARRRYRRSDGAHVWADLFVFSVDFPAAQGLTTLVHLIDVTRTRELELARSRRAALAALGADVTALVAFGASPDEVETLVVRAVAAAFDAAATALVRHDPATRSVRPTALHGRLAPPGPVVADLLGDVRRATRYDGGGAFPGPALAVPFPAGPDGALLLVLRTPGDEHFTRADEELLEELAERVAGAVQLGLAQEAQARLEERQRIARDLHDTVIQDLIALGMRLEAQGERDDAAARGWRGHELVDELEQIVRQLRESVFAFGASPAGLDPRDALVDAVNEAARVLGFQPRVQVTGPIDDVGPVVAAEVQAVLREALANLARHARADWAQVRVRVTGRRLTLTVEDDGVGIDDRPARGNGLVNIRERARALGGDSRIERRNQGGTRLRWQVPLPRATSLPGAVPLHREHVAGPRSRTRRGHDPSP